MKGFLKALFVEWDYIVWFCTATMVFIVVGLVMIAVNGGK